MPGRKYLYTERAHYMSPNMHFGIMAEIGSEFDADGSAYEKSDSRGGGKFKDIL